MSGGGSELAESSFITRRRGPGQTPHLHGCPMSNPPGGPHRFVPNLEMGWSRKSTLTGAPPCGRSHIK